MREGVLGGGLQYKKDGNAGFPLHVEVKKQFWCLLACSASKGPQQEPLRYLSGY